MKTSSIRGLLPILGVAILATVSECRADGPDVDFPYVIACEAGDTEFTPGDDIAITQVRGTAPTITTGAIYSVEGTYVLASRDEASLGLHATSTNRGSFPMEPGQTAPIKRGSGTFRLIKTMHVDGYLHVSFYPAGSGSSFGGIYFGQGDGVLRHKGWSSQAPKAATLRGPGSASSSSGPGVSSDGANKMLFDYLGEPVPPPLNLDPKYSKTGLSNAVRLAAGQAGVKLEVQIDDSEFPFLVGVICSRENFAKVMEQLKRMDGYVDQGSVGSDICQTLNIVPYPAFPPEAGQRISRRLTVREQMFFDQLSGQK